MCVRTYAAAELLIPIYAITDFWQWPPRLVGRMRAYKSFTHIQISGVSAKGISHKPGIHLEYMTFILLYYLHTWSVKCERVLFMEV